MTTSKDKARSRAKPQERAAAKSAAADPSGITATQRHAMIADAAYYLWREQGLLDPDPVRDWLMAERMIDSAILPHR